MRTRRSRSSSNPVPSPIIEVAHRSVLLHEAIEGLALNGDDTVVDATLGGAGHAAAIAGRLSSAGTFIGFDLDHDAIGRAQDALAGAPANVLLIESNFRNLKRELASRGIDSVTKVLFDLGWSSFQLSVGRGFSFLRDEPLLMTYTADPSALTAEEIVNEWEESSLADVIFGWGEERYARRIAKRIVETRSLTPIMTTFQLVAVIKEAVPATYRYGPIHPATRTFQALRIAVNDEMGALEEGLAAAWDMLAPGGRIAVITFHSIEDRIVKQAFLRYSQADGTRITRKPIVPSAAELVENPRARSAKLRIIARP
ncbi:16S rRNA (cytosine(1402)-N(4))-methyltransferase RsmH [Candidatus Kaiserbacteria bacterium]|nr:16S rRNA (cytosine(1402)-N(4))-methyltransferase RsmH [Candidatus Kaiserbacteria bacterium]